MSDKESAVSGKETVSDRELTIGDEELPMGIYAKIFWLSNLLTIFLFIFFFLCAAIGVGNEFFIPLGRFYNTFGFAINSENQENIPLVLFLLWINFFITSVVIVSLSFGIYAWAKKREEQKKLNAAHNETNENNNENDSNCNDNKNKE